jgi:hypothetical protein
VSASVPSRPISATQGAARKRSERDPGHARRHRQPVRAREDGRIERALEGGVGDDLGDELAGADEGGEHERRRDGARDRDEQERHGDGRRRDDERPARAIRRRGTVRDAGPKDAAHAERRHEGSRSRLRRGRDARR